jgi:hypothetical protein
VIKLVLFVGAPYGIDWYGGHPATRSALARLSADDLPAGG